MIGADTVTLSHRHVKLSIAFLYFTPFIGPNVFYLVFFIWFIQKFMPLLIKKLNNGYRIRPSTLLKHSGKRLSITSYKKHRSLVEI